MADEIKTMQEEVPESRNFIHAFIEEDIAPGGQFEGMTVHTRFPPEPNGYLHIGHCKALTIDFGTAEKFGGLCNLRMDDTNPTKEDTEFVDAIQEDIHWLGFDWGDRFFYGSDYFEEDYRQAVGLIKKGLAYVCELSPEEFKEYRGSIGVPAKSPYRDRPIEESLDLFARMRAGEFPNGAMTLRAKIDLASGNFNMRDPVLYRINHMHHHRQGDKWCIYPMYDFAHPIQDALEGITHSLCSLEFEAHRPLYNWVVDNCDLPSKLTITNYPEGKTETVTVENNPLDPDAGIREVSFSRNLYIEADDFLETPVPKYKRLFPGGPECRLKGAYLITCTGCVKDENGNVTEVLCEYDPDSRGGDPADGRKVKGATIHWVDAATAIDAEVRLYDYLFSDESPDGADKDFIDCLNPNSLEVLQGCKVEASLKAAAESYEQTEKKGKTAPSFQFMRLGYFCLDSRDSTPEHLVFNRSVSLKDSFKK